MMHLDPEVWLLLGVAFVATVITLVVALWPLNGGHDPMEQAFGDAPHLPPEARHD